MNMAHRNILKTFTTTRLSALIGKTILSACQSPSAFHSSGNNFKLRTDSQTLIWEMVKQGLGVSFAQFNLIEKTPGMVHIVPDLKIPSMEMWLVAHREVHKAKRIRVIYDLLATELTAYTRS